VEVVSSSFVVFPFHLLECWGQLSWYGWMDGVVSVGFVFWSTNSHRNSQEKECRAQGDKGLSMLTKVSPRCSLSLPYLECRAGTRAHRDEKDVK
jgi:hypothetical protein